jgi:DNA-binding transcriptional ArsR family regulator
MSFKKPRERKQFLTSDVFVYYLLVMELVGYGALDASRLDATFAALADPTRRAILARLASGEASVNELAEPFAMSQPAISKHLKVLERAGLISRGLDAQRRPRRLEAKPLAEANKWLERYRQYWEASFERLDALLLELKDGESKTRASKIQGKKRGRTKRHRK